MERELELERLEIQKLILEYLDSPLSPVELKCVFEYTLRESGKLLRPLLTSFFGEALELDRKTLSSFMIALEMIHVASLIHDDLPGLDNDSTRRGKASTHVRFGEGRAILAGDLMVAKALEVLVKDELISVPDRLSLLSILTQAQVDLCEGQAAELELENTSYSEMEMLVARGRGQEAIAKLKRVNLQKTGALFIAAGLAPTKLAKVSMGMENQIIAIMTNFALAFQLRDDLLDSIHDSEVKKGKEFNYVSLLGQDAAENEINTLIQNTIITLQGLGPRFYKIKGLITELF